jgi:hypothetical protein
VLALFASKFLDPVILTPAEEKGEPVYDATWTVSPVRRSKRGWASRSTAPSSSVGSHWVRGARLAGPLPERERQLTDCEWSCVRA